VEEVRGEDRRCLRRSDQRPRREGVDFPAVREDGDLEKWSSGNSDQCHFDSQGRGSQQA
jgi:hypothetical protein